MGHRGKRPGQGARAFLNRHVRKLVWKMDIHPTAAIASSAYIDRTWPQGVHIGAGTVIDEEAVVLTHDLTRGVRFDTRIGDRCYIGPRAIVMPGVSIGNDAIVAAGSVVTRDVPEKGHVSGNPARTDPTQ